MNNEIIEQILSYFQFDIIEIVAISTLLLLVLFQIFFYFYYYRRPFNYTRNYNVDELYNKSTYPKVSVIISSENEAEYLEENLPLILEQDYPNFEVIVVNDGSTDESNDVLENLKLRYPNLYQTYLPLSSDNHSGRRKLTYTLGIKAAKGEIVLFTEPYCKPVSNKWIRYMVNDISEKTEVVLGYSYYAHSDKFYNRIARFDNYMSSMQYLSMAIREKPYIGTYRNIAFRKDLFFENKGFSSFLNFENGEDLFINQIVNNTNTSVALAQNSMIEANLSSFSLWRSIKKNYSMAQSRIHEGNKLGFKIESISRYFFYILFVLLTAYALIEKEWGLLGLTILLFIIRLSVQLTWVNKAVRYFNSGTFHFSLPLMDILQPIYNVRFRSRSKMVKGKRR